MREILFRGKRVDNGEWVEGCFGQHTSLDAFIIDRPYPAMSGELSALGFYEVDPSTVGQYTGLTDKNGKRIFEGDICLCDRNIAPSVDAQTFQILFDVEAGQWVGRGPNSDIDASQFFMCDVIGNVSDNPELLEGGGTP